MKHIIRKTTGLLLAAVMTVSLCGCGAKTDTTNQTAVTVTATEQVTTAFSEPTLEPTVLSTDAKTVTPTVVTTPSPSPDPLSMLTSEQRNSINMLNHLAVITQEINASSNSRLYLESAYSALINNTYPNAVDVWTLSELEDLLDTLESYRMIAVKRDRLEYIYEQNKAQALRDAVPNPLGLLSAVGSFSLAKIATSVVYMAVDSYTSYTSSSSAADLQYLQDSWALDDEEATALHERRKDAFAYMIRMVSDYDLPGYLALSENAVEEFVKWKKAGEDSGVTRAITFFESNEETYKAFGDYWLTLADCYYRNGDYQKCLEAVTSYESLNIQIFRKDYDYAAILPLAIIAAENVYDSTEYISAAENYARLIMANTDNSDWALRYFAAQTYIGLYGKTGDTQYLNNAFDITVDNVNCLVAEQETLNDQYLAPVVLQEVPSDATKDEKASINEFNNERKAMRNIELAPVYTPLLLNCDLLFSLAEEMNLPQSEKEKIDSILHPGGGQLFLNPLIDSKYTFKTNEPIDVDEIDFSFDGKTMTFPAKLITEDSSIVVSVNRKGSEETVVIDDWSLTKVVRGAEDDVSSFTASFTSNIAEDFDYGFDAEICIELSPSTTVNVEPLCIMYKSVDNKKNWYEHIAVWNETTVFERVIQ